MWGSFKISCAVLLGVFSLGVIFILSPALAQADALVSEVNSNGRIITLTVNYKPSKEAWANHITTQAKIFLQAFEPYLGINLPAWANNQVVINGCDSCQARLDGGQIYVQ
ncbi:MAG: hypothetical protein IT292_10760 [Deltaproteobacteria bacterium]|nr:hypothetical protein [Deltaproteobacteria bacterium]